MSSFKQDIRAHLGTACKETGIILVSGALEGNGMKCLQIFTSGAKALPSGIGTLQSVSVTCAVPKR